MHNEMGFDGNATLITIGDWKVSSTYSPNESAHAYTRERKCTISS